MTNRVDEVTIVGGGTAGWLTALSLISFLNAGREGPPVRVTLIESPKVPTIGVGEATVAGLPLLLKQLGVNEQAFFRACNTSFKLSVRFGHWAEQPSGAPIDFYQQFNYPRHLEGFIPAYYYKKYGALDGSLGGAFAEAMVANTALVKAYRGPRRLDQGPYDQAINYAYHLDAALFGKFLRTGALGRGVRHVLDDVVAVERDERGYISALELEQGGRHPVEFVIDCTGFQGLILQKHLEEPFISFSDNLLCDRAIPVQLPHRDPERIEPCTRATALGAGWVWRVPLHSRVGTGYVYASRFRSDDEAKAEFLGHLRRFGDLPAAAPEPELRVIKMRIGRARRAWVKNCVAIGLAGGFIEPLESTAIHMIDASVRWFAGLYPDRAVSPELAEAFNRRVEQMYDEVRDFIQTQYLTSNRPEPFWQAARGEVQVAPDLRQRLAQWRRVLPDQSDTPGHGLFNYWNYIYALWPKGHFEGAAFPLEGSIARRPWERFSQRLARERSQLLASLPDHVTLLRQIRGEAPPAERAAEVPAHAVPDRLSAAHPE